MSQVPAAVASAPNAGVAPATARQRAPSPLDLQPAALIGTFLLVVILLTAILAPFIVPFDPQSMSDATLRPPDSIFWMGTDDLGRDVFSRVVYGARVSLTIGLFSALIATLVGSCVGALAGYFGGLTDDLLMRLTELFQVIPRFLLAIVVVALLGAGQWKIILVIGLLSWPGTARIVRAQFLLLRRQEFVLAARVVGAEHRRVIVTHIIPNVLPFIIVSGSLQTASAILVESFLSFLGLGDPSEPSWGLLLQTAQLFLRRAWWMAAFPGIAIFLTILALNLAGDGLGELLNPRRRQAVK
ncbi:MAG: ABC transporter permease [Chloroflexi bacterium]|nr:ABC transporter permease [Chloroflexota bacterium]